MNEKSTTRTAHYREGDVPAGRTDWARLRAMSEEEIEAGAESDPDNPPLTAEDFASGEIVLPSDRRRKTSISTRVDSDALVRFKEKGPRYQTRINELIVADSEDRVLILDENVARGCASIKNRSAVLNAILRQHAPITGAPAPEWSGGNVAGSVQRIHAVKGGGWVVTGRAAAERKPETGRHAS